MVLQAGSAVVDITPRTPCFLAGYAARDHAHEGVHDPLSLRALYLRGPSGDALLVSADIIWFYEDAVERMLPVLERELGLNPVNVLFANCGMWRRGRANIARFRSGVYGSVRCVCSGFRARCFRRRRWP